ncbi:unnamed protein product [Prorocentrum cordatum]|uniref:Sialidase domain-containing protein n=1 Tax=Prorocentrum cordatum TaxID=2364126 RepID=A0ABN9TDG1_9DINO|nr:unnamed protein product [Polarella glacialis]
MASISATIAALLPSIAAWSDLTPSPQCQAQMDTWCNNVDHCAKVGIGGEPYFARLDMDGKDAGKEWRCYPASTLNLDHSYYVGPGIEWESGICSRDAQLRAVLAACSADIFVTTVFKGGTEGCVMYRTPSLVRVENGTLLAFTQCRQQSHGDTSPQSLHLKRSHDNGQTWGPTTILPFAANEDFSQQHRASTLYDTTTGTIFLFDDARPIGSSDTCEVQIWRTEDLGETWASVQNLTDDAANLTGSALATGIRLPSGKLLICMRAGCNGRESPNGDHALWSEDGGVTWTAGGRMSDDGARLHGWPTAASSPSAAPPRGRPRSSPHSPPTRAAPGARRGWCRSSRATPWRSPRSWAAGRSNLTVRRSRDGGETWPEGDAVQIWEGPSAYSCLGSTADGALAVLWEKDGADLGFAKTFSFASAPEAVV